MGKLIILLWALPTFVLANSIAPFLPVTHPWKNRVFTLRDWTSRRTELGRIFDSVLWGQIVFLTVLVLTI